MPKNAIAADMSKHNKSKYSYNMTFWYEDKQIQCRDCSCIFVFTKEEQKHWYEDLRLPIYANAVRCLNCRIILRKKRDFDRAEQLKHMAEVAARIPHPNEAFFKRRS